MFSIEDYDYRLPGHLIAQHPVPERDSSRLMVVDRKSGRTAHHRFDALPELLSPGDLVVINNTEVVAARLFGKKETGGRVEVLILDYHGGAEQLRSGGRFVTPCLLRASKRPKPGSRIRFDDECVAEVLENREGTDLLRFESPGDIEKAIARLGLPPLPPYIRRESTEAERAADARSYQTVYARIKGAVAAPTAGLHFTQKLMERLAASGIEIVPITLHVGYGTFLPVRVNDIRDHRMHGERFDLSTESARAINRAKAEGRRIVAVGTTSVRTLEYAAGPDGKIKPGAGENHLFIYPGHTFRMVDAMVTNFHLPKSTLLMLVSAFAGRDAILGAYGEAIRREYRFYSYGDAMLIL